MDGTSIGGSLTIINDNSGTLNIINGPDGEAAEIKRIFVDALRDRSIFIEKMHRQALQQANLNYVIYTIFAVFGGVAVLAAAALALVDRTNTVQSISLVSGLGGILVGTCGAALAYRADQARKHLAAQGEKVHEEIRMERRLAEAAGLVAGIKNPELGDQARISLALRILNEGNAPGDTAETQRDTDPT
ncbi:TRADD-N-associated membrane domain-containing protein [Nocardia mangyaensis]|uniref:TRADD-N-associated membrane domain-containing protein n=1 Tax=Nocardia mangyaensis TaxID=2213200 RepID=UPI0012EC8DD0|nr:hypothetical protein [Nocardia mangyaensis]